MSFNSEFGNVETLGQLQVHLCLKRADLTQYYDKLISLGGDNISYLSELGEEDLAEVAELVGMATKPLHVARFVKVLSEWQSDPSSFGSEMKTFDMFPVNSIKIKKNSAKEIEHRIRQLCEDFCDQADEGYTEEQKCEAEMTRMRLAQEYGSDIDALQAFCLEACLTRDCKNSDGGNVVEEELFVQIALTLCSIDATFLESKEKLVASAHYIRSQFKDLWRENDEHSDSESTSPQK